MNVHHSCTFFIYNFIHLSIPQFFHSFYSSRLRSGCSSSTSLITCSSSEAETRNHFYINITPRLRSGCISRLRSGCSSSTSLITCSSSEAETRSLLYINITPRLRSGCFLRNHSPLHAGNNIPTFSISFFNFSVLQFFNSSISFTILHSYFYAFPTPPYGHLSSDGNIMAAPSGRYRIIM